MKQFLITALFAATPLITMAGTYTYEPYFDAQYSCNWFEGTNTKITFEADSFDEAVAVVNYAVGKQAIEVTCNKDVYQCVHHQDVEPRVIQRRSEIKKMVMIAADLYDASGNARAHLGEALYHRNLKRLPRCN